MLNWFACELHTHTINSDGNFTLEQLLESAKTAELKCIALTDHNTDSGCNEITEEFEKEYLPVIKGIEWTTYFGHMVVLAADKYVDWRESNIDNIDERIEEIKKANGVVGIAHPFRMGSPIGTGCFWEFNIRNWNNVDYYEIWSGQTPSIRQDCKRAYEFWRGLLNQGYKIAATYGRDWHGNDEQQNLYAATYLGIIEDQIDSKAAINALTNRRTYVSVGPFVNFRINGNQQTYYIGDTVECGEYICNIYVDMGHRSSVRKDFNICISSITLISNNKVILKRTSKDTACIKVNEKVNLQPGWVIVQVEGTIDNQNAILAITSPIYCKKMEE